MKSNLDVGKKYQALMEQKKKVDLYGAFGVLQYATLSCHHFFVAVIAITSKLF